MLPDKPRYTSKAENAAAYRIIIVIIVIVVFFYIAISHYIIMSSFDSNGPMSNEHINHGHTMESLWMEGLPPQPKYSKLTSQIAVDYKDKEIEAGVEVDAEELIMTGTAVEDGAENKDLRGLRLERVRNENLRKRMEKSKYRPKK